MKFDKLDLYFIGKAMRTSHTWCLDALSSSITSGDAEAIHKNLSARRRIRYIADQCEMPINDDYRMKYIQALADKYGIRLDA